MGVGSSYKIIKEIGKGAFGTVYLIEKDNKNYALKKIHINNIDNQANKYQDEINNLSAFNNEYIIKYYDSKITKNDIVIFMEYGGDLNLKMFIENYKKKNQLINEEIIDLCLQKVDKELKGDKNMRYSIMNIFLVLI